jgi:hypothetical protein
MYKETDEITISGKEANNITKTIKDQARKIAELEKQLADKNQDFVDKSWDVMELKKQNEIKEEELDEVKYCFNKERGVSKLMAKAYMVQKEKAQFYELSFKTIRNSMNAVSQDMKDISKKENSVLKEMNNSKEVKEMFKSLYA